MQSFFGGLALLLGLLTRPAALACALTMLVALFSVHMGNGLFLANNGYEYALVLLAATAALAIQGGGRFALDNRLWQYLEASARTTRADLA